MPETYKEIYDAHLQQVQRTDKGVDLIVDTMEEEVDWLKNIKKE